MHEHVTKSVPPETTETSPLDPLREAIAASIATELYRAIMHHTPPLQIGSQRKSREPENAQHLANMIVVAKEALFAAVHECVPQKPLQVHQVERPGQIIPDNDDTESPSDASPDIVTPDASFDDLPNDDSSPDNTDGRDDIDDEAAFAYLCALNRGTNAAQYVDRLRLKRKIGANESDTESNSETSGIRKRASDGYFGDENVKRQQQGAELRRRQEEAERAIATRRAREMELMRTETQKPLIREKLPIWVSKFREPLCFLLYVLGQTPGRYMTLDQMIVAMEAQSIEALVEEIFPEMDEPKLPNRRETALEKGREFLKNKHWADIGDARDNLDEIEFLAIALHQEPFRVKSTTTENNSKAYTLAETDSLADYGERSQAAGHAWGQTDHDGVSIFDRS